MLYDQHIINLIKLWYVFLNPLTYRLFFNHLKAISIITYMSNSI